MADDANTSYLAWRSAKAAKGTTSLTPPVERAMTTPAPALPLLPAESFMTPLVHLWAHTRQKREIL